MARPAMLARGLSASEERELARWWQKLSVAERRSLRRHPGGAPAGVVARFVDAEAAENESDQNVDFYEYLVNHELWLEDGRKFHICSAHPQARALLAAGKIPSEFACPRSEASCPMRALLGAANGASVRLTLARGPSSTEEQADG